ncbi:hypothetical protein K3757_03920 [Sulfitobacter sp. S223]|uniref:hypothetical protein n=1 Tax=Sulfitobacter sp. S223 TaxID=2867023 RepID=UPI0021A7564B|nr:hypothetical protein [Sulfitobacter sp. S223]UWR27096.1 hypothetical protein K3757_03920 [Sulfitobacter sp. S223]
MQDREVQGTVIALFEDQYTQAVMKRQTAWAMQDHSKFDALLASLDDDDEFILR